MKLTNTQKSILDKDTQVLIEAGFLSEDLKITDDLGYFIRHLNFVSMKKEIVARAKEIVAENKADKCDCD